MAMNINLFVIFIVFFSTTFFTALSKQSSSDINWWCKKTPHPEPCKFFMGNSRHHFAPRHMSDFRKMAVEVAMDRALKAQRHALQLGQNLENKSQKAAFSDCLKLYDNTISQLNRTLQGLGPNRSCSDFDAQTWLSTALTNIETCRAGSLELNVSDTIVPIMSNNVSELISNGLALNGVYLNEESKNHAYGSFPSWVSKQGRKLLQSSSIKANVVVAKDGSGNYQTVQSAINAAAGRSGTGRFIIYVKRGVYRENIEVDNNNNNIMLVGDGMRYTIITSSRSVGGGYTTYSSATAGEKFHPPLSLFLSQTHVFASFSMHTWLYY
jgi:pectinesterase